MAAVKEQLADLNWPALTADLDLLDQVAEYWAQIPAAEARVLMLTLDALVKSGQDIRVTVGNLKGGAIKTTITIHLLMALALTGEPVLGVDADQTNNSVVLWKSAMGDEWPIWVQVLPWSGTDLPKKLQAISGTFRHLVVDTSPSHVDLLEAALHSTDTFLITSQPNPLDVAQLDKSIDVAVKVDALKPDGLASVIIYARAKKRTDNLKKAKVYADDKGWPRLEAIIMDRVAHANTFGYYPWEWRDFAWLVHDLIAYELDLDVIPGLEEEKAAHMQEQEGA